MFFVEKNKNENKKAYFVIAAITLSNLVLSNLRYGLLKSFVTSDRAFFIFFLIFGSFRGNSSKKFDFGHRLGVLDRPGNRELRAVKIPVSYDAWRPPKGQKNDSDLFFIFLGFRKSVFRNFSCIFEGIDNVRRQSQFRRKILLQTHSR